MSDNLDMTPHLTLTPEADAAAAAAPAAPEAPALTLDPGAAAQEAAPVQGESVLSEEERQKQREQKWQGVSEKTQTGLETVLAGQATGGEAVLEQIRVANRDDVDYRAFLRRFAVPREVMAVDGDAFDYIFYTYGLQLYGNMPLVEPPETKEEKRIEDFVIAVDTSMSTSGELVRQFLACTYAILRSTETFTRKVNIRSGSTMRPSRSTFSYSGCFSITGSREENTSSTVWTNSGSLPYFCFTWAITLARYAFI